MPLTIVPFGSTHLDDAAELLARRQTWLREVESALPLSFTHAAATRPLLEALAGEHGAYGVVAFEAERMVAYLTGAPRHDEVWDRAVWSGIEASAIDPGAPRELMRDLYAAWAPHWVERGIFHHYVHAPTADAALLAAWFDLNFGKMQAHAVRDLALALDSADAPGVEIRRLGADDAALIEPLQDLIARQHVESPTYAVTLPERYEAFAADYATDMADPSSRYWAAFDADQPVGLAAFGDAARGPMVPDGAWELGVAMTIPWARGRGIQRALLATAFAAARRAGASHSITDWRTANLLSSRAWPALGYRTTHVRLHRAVDPRVAWARGQG